MTPAIHERGNENELRTDRLRERTTGRPCLVEGRPIQGQGFPRRKSGEDPNYAGGCATAVSANAEYISLASSGSNALDFHIAYYIGNLSAQEPSAFFHVVSKDTGFDPLIAHLRTKGMLAQRSTSISSMPCFRPPLPTAIDAQVDTVVAHLARLKAAKPRAHKTLLSTLHALFKKELSGPQLNALFAALCKRGIVKLDGTKVSYDLSLAPKAALKTPREHRCPNQVRRTCDRTEYDR